MLELPFLEGVRVVAADTSDCAEVSSAVVAIGQPSLNPDFSRSDAMSRATRITNTRRSLTFRRVRDGLARGLAGDAQRGRADLLLAFGKMKIQRSPRGAGGGQNVL